MKLVTPSAISTIHMGNMALKTDWNKLYEGGWFIIKKLRVYLDTSVISHLQQEDVPEKMHETLELWEQFKERKDVEVIISTLVFTELYKCNEQKLAFLLGKLAQLDYNEVPITDSVRELTNFYLKNGVLRKKSADDLTHIAAATLNDCRYIISWNFKHFVNPKTINAVNAINLTLNLPQIGIFSPNMMLGGF